MAMMPEVRNVRVTDPRAYRTRQPKSAVKSFRKAKVAPMATSVLRARSYARTHQSATVIRGGKVF